MNAETKELAKDLMNRALTANGKEWAAIETVEAWGENAPKEWAGRQVIHAVKGIDANGIYGRNFAILIDREHPRDEIDEDKHNTTGLNLTVWKTRHDKLLVFTI